MTEFWLIRHGQTNWNLTGRWQGQTPLSPGLNETGRRQVLAIRDQLQGMMISAVYSSDLLRASQTAELLAASLGLPVMLEPRLREIDLGIWEGMLSEEIEQKYPQELADRARNPFYSRAPQGESPHDVAKRVLAAMDEIAEPHRDESILIVSHGIALAIIICHAEGISLEDVYQHIPDNALPYRVQWRQ